MDWYPSKIASQSMFEKAASASASFLSLVLINSKLGLEDNSKARCIVVTFDPAKRNFDPNADFVRAKIRVQLVQNLHTWITFSPNFKVRSYKNEPVGPILTLAGPKFD